MKKIEKTLKNLHNKKINKLKKKIEKNTEKTAPIQEL